MHAMLGGLSEPWVSGTEGPDTFSPFDVVGHLIDGEETDWMPRARIILARGADPRFEPYDRFRHKARNVERTMSSLLSEFTRLRSDNLTELRGWRLGPAELGLPGTHPSLGPVTLRQLLAAWVVHDLEHVAQAARHGQAVRVRSWTVGAVPARADRPSRPQVVMRRGPWKTLGFP